MDYKRLYEQSLERARVWKEKSGMPQNKQGILDDIFPELEESEDEKIRKLLVEAVTQVLQDQYCSNRGVSKEKVVAWLERQGNNINCIYDKELSELLHIVICRYINDPNISYPERENVSKKILPYVELLEKQGEVESDNDDIEVEEKGIREAFNKIEDEKQCKQKPQRMISAEAKEAMYNKPADTVEPKYEESKTKIFDAPTPFEDKLYAFVLACEILVDPSKREFILEHSQEILDAAREQIGKEQSSTWSEKDEEMRLTVLQDLQNIKESYPNVNVEPEFNWLKSLKTRYTWKPSDEQLEALKDAIHIKPFENPSDSILWGLYEQLKKLREE